MPSIWSPGASDEEAHPGCGKSTFKARLFNTALRGCASIGNTCSKTACLGQRNNSGRLKPARSPKTRSLPPAAAPEPSRVPAALVASWLFSRLPAQLQQPAGIKMQRGNSLPVRSSASVLLRGRASRECPEARRLPKNRLPRQRWASPPRRAAAPLLLPASPQQRPQQADRPQRALLKHS